MIHFFSHIHTSYWQTRAKEKINSKPETRNICDENERDKDKITLKNDFDFFLEPHQNVKQNKDGRERRTKMKNVSRGLLVAMKMVAVMMMLESEQLLIPKSEEIQNV